MQRYDYLIIGGGMVADAAARGIRESDETGTIGILSADVDAPYARPALSKKLWVDPDFAWEDVPLGTAGDTGADVLLKTEVEAIDREAREVSTRGGERYGYGALLVATGATPTLVDAAEGERIIAFRSAADYRRLRELSETDGARIVVVGGGYIGTEIAAALAVNGVTVALVFPDDVLGASTFPPELAARFEALYRDGGVELVRSSTVSAAQADATAAHATLETGVVLEADAVVFGLGATPAVSVAERAGLKIDADNGGIAVDETLRTNDPHVWAAGDVASYPDPILGRTRVEHVDNAQEMGAAAGRSMAGDASYTHTPYFYSQVFGVRWEAVGTLDPDADPLVVELEPDEGGPRTVVYYRDGAGAPTGVLLWRVEDRRDEARAVLADAPTSEEELRRRIR